MGDYVSSDNECYYDDCEDDNGDCYDEDDGGDDSVAGFNALDTETELLSANATVPSTKVTRLFRLFTFI